mgnify:FL=1|jgi:hypothetical protein|tara:strand:+ start:165 stop:329 length:165 start_codon:yes stop_codon:yes gene_type:complete
MIKKIMDLVRSDVPNKGTVKLCKKMRSNVMWKYNQCIREEGHDGPCRTAHGKEF